MYVFKKNMDYNLILFENHLNRNSNCKLFFLNLLALTKPFYKLI